MNVQPHVLFEAFTIITLYLCKLQDAFKAQRDDAPLRIFVSIELIEA